MSTIYVILAIALITLAILLKLMRVGNASKFEREQADDAQEISPVEIDELANQQFSFAETPEQPDLDPAEPGRQAKTVGGSIMEAGSGIFIHAAAREGVLTGAALLALAETQNLQLEGDAFCKHMPDGNLAFKMTSAPGGASFQSVSEPNYQTQAVVLTLDFRDSDNPVEAFVSLKQAVHYLAGDLQTILRDRQHNVITNQTLNYYKNLATEYHLQKTI